MADDTREEGQMNSEGTSAVNGYVQHQCRDPGPLYAAAEALH